MMALLLEAATREYLVSFGFFVALTLGGILGLLWMIESRLAEIKKLLEKRQ
jgi:hypothetical protein